RREPMPQALADRMVADALAVQAGRAAMVAPASSGAGIWAQLRGALGGWAGMSGLATACAAGVWMGLAPPTFLPDPAQLVYDTGAEGELFGGSDLALLLAEGN
ncbi:hypothetical protein AB9K41_28465, partial [Cribrihabitans sp. XS_ASV171]